MDETFLEQRRLAIWEQEPQERIRMQELVLKIEAEIRRVELGIEMR
jgi:hypothetical protein